MNVLSLFRHMAKDEMDFITEDRWDEDIWGIEHEDPDTKSRSPKLIFYFGQNVCLKKHCRPSQLLTRTRITG